MKSGDIVFIDFVQWQTKQSRAVRRWQSDEIAKHETTSAPLIEPQHRVQLIGQVWVIHDRFMGLRRRVRVGSGFDHMENQLVLGLLVWIPSVDPFENGLLCVFESSANKMSGYQGSTEYLLKVSHAT